MASSHELSDVKNHLANRGMATRIVESAVLAAINVLAIVGNFLVCVAVYRRQSLRTVANMFIVGLAVTGILMSTLVMPMSLVAQIFDYWPSGEHMCQIQGFILYLLVFQALQLITLTAVNRNLHVSRPSLHKRIATRRNALIAIFSTTLLSGVAVGCLTLALSVRFEFHPGKVFCSVVVPNLTLSRQFTLMFAVLFVALPAFVTAVCYVMILAKIRRHSDRFEACRGEHDSRAILSREGSKVTRIVLVIISGFLLCWVPCVIIDVIDTSREHYLPRELYLTYTYLGYSSVMISPWIYGGMDKQVRKEMFSLCFCRAAHHDSNVQRVNTATLMALTQL